MILAPTIALTVLLSACGGDEQDEDGSPGAQNDDGAAAEGSPQDDADDSTDTDADDSTDTGSGAELGVAELSDPAGNEVGSVTFREADGAVELDVDVEGFDPGFRGLSLHENPVCEPQSENEDGITGDFMSAGGHFEGDPEEALGIAEGEETAESEDEAAEDTPADADTGERGTEDQQLEEAGAQTELTHPDRAGDLPNLLVSEDGTGRMTVVSDRLHPEDIASGLAVIISADPDNHARIPERYAPQGPDAETLIAGDSGERSACGIVGEAADD